MNSQVHTHNPTRETQPLVVLQQNTTAPVRDVTNQAVQILGQEWHNVDLLPYRTAFILSDTNGLDTYRDASDLANEAMLMLAVDAGGSMSFRGNGKYVSSSNTMISESIHLIEAFYSSAEAQLAALPKISAFLRKLRNTRKQESVAVKLNSALIILY